VLDACEVDGKGFTLQPSKGIPPANDKSLNATSTPTFIDVITAVLDRGAGVGLWIR